MASSRWKRRMERPEPKASSPSREMTTVGPVVAFDDAGRGNADHAAMPAIAIDHDAEGLANAGSPVNRSSTERRIFRSSSCRSVLS